MSYTNAELLRRHLTSPYPALDRVTDQVVILEDLEPTMFFGGTIDEESVVVKNIQTNTLTRVAGSFAEGVLSLGAGSLVRGSVLVASDSSLVTVYTENLDFIVDYEYGVLTRKAGGVLADDVSYVIWYAIYHVYEKDVDFELDADSGELSRVNGSDIASGEAVLVDYTPVFASFTDAILESAAVEANALVEAELDPEKQYGGDPILQAAATANGLAIVCRSAASRELSRLRGEERAAAGWLDLAEVYANRGEQLIKAFRPPMSGPSSPVHG